MVPLSRRVWKTFSLSVGERKEIRDMPATRTSGTTSKAGGSSGARGFAAMPAEKQRKIASMGGKAAHEKGTAHEFTSKEARIAGRKGGSKEAAARSSRFRISHGQSEREG